MPKFAVFLYLFAAFSATAQPPARGPRNVTAAHIHLNSADPEAAIAFWKNAIGMVSYSYESLNGVSTLGATLLFTRKAPSGPSADSVIESLVFKVPDAQPFIDRVAKTPYKSFRPKAGEDRVIVDGPDGVRIELLEDNSMYAPLEFSSIHLQSPQPKEMQAWYVKNLGGQPGADENADSVQIPGARLTFSEAASATPSADRAIGSLGFEVRSLDEFCKKLTENGVKLDVPPHAVPEMKASVASLTDPWGTRIELTEKAAP